MSREQLDDVARSLEHARQDFFGLLERYPNLSEDARSRAIIHRMGGAITELQERARRRTLQVGPRQYRYEYWTKAPTDGAVPTYNDAQIALNVTWLAESVRISLSKKSDHPEATVADYHRSSDGNRWIFTVTTDCDEDEVKRVVGRWMKLFEIQGHLLHTSPEHEVYPAAGRNSL